MKQFIKVVDREVAETLQSLGFQYNHVEGNMFVYNVNGDLLSALKFISEQCDDKTRRLFVYDNKLRF